MVTVGLTNSVGLNSTQQKTAESVTSRANGATNTKSLGYFPVEIMVV